MTTFAEPHPTPPPVNRPAPARPLVLVAEDESTVREMVRVVLEMDGFEVLEAESGDRAVALARVRLHAVSVLLTDVRMPGLTGPELARTLRSDRPELPVVFMSGYVGDAACGYDSDLARSEFVAKPFKLDELRSAVRRAVRRGPAVQPRKTNGRPAPAGRPPFHVTRRVTAAGPARRSLPRSAAPLPRC